MTPEHAREMQYTNVPNRPLHITVQRSYHKISPLRNKESPQCITIPIKAVALCVFVSAEGG